MTVLLNSNYCTVHSYMIVKLLVLVSVASLAYITWLQYENETRYFKPSVKIQFVKKYNLRTFKRTTSPTLTENLTFHATDYHLGKREDILQNITLDLLTNRLFTSVRDEPYIPKWGQYFKPNSSTDNGLDHKFVLNGKSVCEKINNPYLLILFPSTIKDKAFRLVIRQTWMRAAEINQWPKRPITKSIRHVFFLGLRTAFSDEDVRSVYAEAKSYEDIVLADLTDTYRNLSRKMVTALQWVDTYCPGVQYVLKCDQDTFVNVPLLLQFMSEVETKFNERNFVMGKTHFAQPKVDRKGRWAVSVDEYPLQYFPLYSYGHTYVIGGKAISALLSVVNRAPLIGPEDVLITGILPKMAGVRRLHAQCFAVCCRDIYDCEVIRNQYVSMTSLNRAKDHRRIWKSVKAGKCHPKAMFNYHLRHKVKKLKTREGLQRNYQVPKLSQIKS